MVLEAEKQYRRYLQDCLDTYEMLKFKTCIAESDNYEFMEQRDNPFFYAEVLFPVFKDCKVIFIEFSYEDPDEIIKRNELYWTIAFRKEDTSRIKEWFIKNTNLDFCIDLTHINFDLMRILANDILDMLYSNEVDELENYLKESSKQCEEEDSIFNYTKPPRYISKNTNWSFNEM